MIRMLQLMRADGAHLLRDPMLGLALIAPAALTAIVRWGLPYVTELAREQRSLDLTPFHQLILGFALLLIPLLIGTVAGLLMLEDRDQDLIAYFGVTPLTRTGYFWYRISLPLLLAAGFVAAFPFLTGYPQPWTALWGAPILAIALEAPLIALFIAAFAANKVEGLAYAKGAGLFVSLPVLALLVPEPWRWLVGFLPTYWALQAQLSGAGWVTAVAIVWHVVWIAWLLRSFSSRAE